jgi:bacteriocin-like protein
MRKQKQHRKSSTDSLLKTNTRDIELTEKELRQVTGGDKYVDTKTGSSDKYIDVNPKPIYTKIYTQT